MLEVLPFWTNTCVETSHYKHKWVLQVRTPNAIPELSLILNDLDRIENRGSS